MVWVLHKSILKKKKIGYLFFFLINNLKLLSVNIKKVLLKISAAQKENVSLTFKS